VGRALGDTAENLWGLAITATVGFAVGFRVHGSVAEALVAFGLLIVLGFAFEWVFITLGMMAGNAQAGQGFALLIFPLTFVSSAYVPVESMPGWLQAFAEHQPITVIADAVRALALGDAGQKLLEPSTSWYVGRSLLWGDGVGGGLRPAGDRSLPPWLMVLGPCAARHQK
jgi:ABC-2 type transport system permease protein